MEGKSDQTWVRILSFDASSEVQLYWFHYYSCRRFLFAKTALQKALSPEKLGLSI